MFNRKLLFCIAHCVMFAPVQLKKRPQESARNQTFLIVCCAKAYVRLGANSEVLGKCG
jgi:hypothetical protein